MVWRVLGRKKGWKEKAMCMCVCMVQVAGKGAGRHAGAVQNPTNEPVRREREGGAGNFLAHH